MEQQMEPKLTTKTTWLDQDGEDDEEESGVGLLARDSSHHPSVGVGTTPTTSTATTSGEPEPEPEPALAGPALTPTDGDENEEDKVVKGEGDGIGNSVYFDKLQGTESINRISQMLSEIPKILSLETNHQQVKNREDQNIFGLSPASAEQLQEETNTSFKHFDNVTKADINVDLIGEIEEDLMEFDVERVLEKQNTHDLFCPKCNSCITRRVILRRRKPKSSNIRQKPKPVKNFDRIPDSVDDGRSGDTSEIYSNVSTTSAPDEQNNGAEQEEEAYSCSSCFSLFIPIGNGCFKIFQFFRHGRQTEHARSLQEISRHEDTQNPQNINQNEAKTNWIFSVFGFHKGKATVKKEDIEAGLPASTFPPGTEVAPSSSNEHRGADAGESHEWEILKSIVYGGLTESITSLSVVSSAAGAGADTLNVLALGLANLIGGLIVISHNLRELKNDQPGGASTEINIEEDRYQALLGRRQHFVLHATVAILSFLVFGLVPPVVYGFSFRKSDDKDLKLAAVAGASLVCIVLLALGKGHVRNPHKTYFRTVTYYVFLGFTASGISYVVGELSKKVLEKLGLFESSSAAVGVPFLETIPLEAGRASY